MGPIKGNFITVKETHASFRMFGHQWLAGGVKGYKGYKGTGSETSRRKRVEGSTSSLRSLSFLMSKKRIFS